MKKHFLVISIAILFIGELFSQNVVIDKDSATGKYSYSEVLKVDGKSAEQLYKNAKYWIVLNFKSAKDVIQLEDKENNKIICKGNFETGWMGKSGHVNNTMILEFKDNRYKITVTDFSYYSSGSGEVSFDGPMAFRKSLIKDSTKKLQDIIHSLNKKIKINESKSNDDW